MNKDPQHSRGAGLAASGADQGKPKVVVLGGGPAGLAAGYYVAKNGLDCLVLEAGATVGGNCRTLAHGPFRFDSGAHRFHDKNPDVTRELQSLFADGLHRVTAPSRILHRGRFVDFPLSPLNLATAVGPVGMTKAAVQMLAGKLKRNNGSNGSFADYATRTYGREIADRFLLGYSEKLWGLPAAQLSPSISGKRMKGLNLGTFVREAFLGAKAKTEHLDGSFYYPETGIGEIPERLAKEIGAGKIRTGAEVTGVHHADGRITSVEINGEEDIPADFVVSTLPLPMLPDLLRPAPANLPSEAARQLRFRDLTIVALFLNREQVSDCATIYFPDREFMFTRLHEPSRRSPQMAPQGKTSLIAELPCFEGDDVWSMPDSGLVEKVIQQTVASGLVDRADVEDARVHRMAKAYPVLQLHNEDLVRALNTFVDGYENLYSAGRNGRFLYTHIHDMMQMGRDVAEQIAT